MLIQTVPLKVARQEFEWDKGKKKILTNFFSDLKSDLALFCNKGHNLKKSLNLWNFPKLRIGREIIIFIAAFYFSCLEFHALFALPPWWYFVDLRCNSALLYNKGHNLLTSLFCPTWLTALIAIPHTLGLQAWQ